MAETSILLDALLRRDLASFIAKTFATLCPGEVYEHNWHIDHLAHRLTRRSRRNVCD
jgi:hypothetical protein